MPHEGWQGRKQRCVHASAHTCCCCRMHGAQVLEISSREGSLMAEQLGEVQRRLDAKQKQLSAMSSSHARTLSKLETAKVRLAPLLCAMQLPGTC